MATNHIKLSNQEIIDKLNALELRLSHLEAYSGVKQLAVEESKEQELMKDFKKISDGNLLETKIGESGLAWLGNIVLFFGIAFLVQYVQNYGYQIASFVFGLIAVTGIFVIAYFLKKMYPTMASIFNMNAYLLLFYILLKLHFFTPSPLIASKSIGLILLVIATTIALIMSVKNKSVTFTGVTMLLFSIVAIVSNSTHFILPVSVFIATISVILMFRYGWTRLMYLTIILSYLINLIWFLNNPFMGNQLQALLVHNFGFIYLFMLGAIYSVIAIIKKSDSISQNRIIGLLVLNGLGFSLLLILYILSFFKADYVLLIGSVSVFCLLYAVILQLKSDWKIVAALYALYGFVTLSVAVHGIYDFPRAYFLLAIQSILVVSMAIWFRSKFIVVMNTLLFLTLLVFYLNSSPVINGVNISFSLAALITARILNWRKDRLTIKTDLLRNVYLLTGFTMVLITLYHLLPVRYITLSWTVVAVVYFGLSFILKNVKYRYMALASMIAAAFYFFIVDLAKIELVFRIVALLFLALISIGLSVFYARKSKRKESSTNT